MQRGKTSRVLVAWCFRESVSLKDVLDHHPTVSYDPFLLLTLIFPGLAFFFPGLSLSPPGLSLSPPGLSLSPPGLYLLLPLRLPWLALCLPWLSQTSFLSVPTQRKLYALSIPSFCP